MAYAPFTIGYRNWKDKNFLRHCATVQHVFDILTTYFEDFHYIGIFIAFVIAGVGVPIPEDIILLASGYMVHLQPERLSLKFTILVCMLGIFTGDTLIYWMGRIWGTRILRLPILRRTITPSMIKKAERYFAKYGDKAVFFARFFAGIRMATFFTAGTMRMPYWKYILVDMLAALTSPIWVILGWHFGDHIDTAFAAAARLKHWILFIMLTLLAAYIVYLILSRRTSRKGTRRTRKAQTARTT